MEISTTHSNNRLMSRDGQMVAHDCGQVPHVRPPYCRQRVQLFNDEPSRTQQSHFDQTDVNAIVKRFERTGVLPEGRGIPQYGDVTGLQGEFTDLINRSRAQQTEAQAFIDGWKPPESAPAQQSPPTPTDPTGSVETPPTAP